jgi:hypothetical protein
MLNAKLKKKFFPTVGVTRVERLQSWFMVHRSLFIVHCSYSRLIAQYSRLLPSRLTPHASHLTPSSFVPLVPYLRVLSGEFLTFFKLNSKNTLLLPKNISSLPPVLKNQIPGIRSSGNCEVTDNKIRRKPTTRLLNIRGLCLIFQNLPCGCHVEGCD